MSHVYVESAAYTGIVSPSAYQVLCLITDVSLTTPTLPAVAAHFGYLDIAPSGEFIEIAPEAAA